MEKILVYERLLSELFIAIVKDKKYSIIYAKIKISISKNYFQALHIEIMLLILKMVITFESFQLICIFLIFPQILQKSGGGEGGGTVGPPVSPWFLRGLVLECSC